MEEGNKLYLMLVNLGKGKNKIKFKQVKFIKLFSNVVLLYKFDKKCIKLRLDLI